MNLQKVLEDFFLGTLSDHHDVIVFFEKKFFCIASLSTKELKLNI